MKNLRKQKTSSRRKQRKAHFACNDGEKRIRSSARLSRELRKEYGFRTFPLRTGDTVVVKGGKFDGKEGVISKINYRDYKVYIEGCFVTKNDGTNALVPIYPSKLTITKFFLENGRKEQLERKKRAREHGMEILRKRQEEVVSN
ncbi:60S RIBOSOMAL PROTEIN L26 [Encephalitozoon cuniculi GB-M1]|uniref:60S RIBOSOMAL PROTEIN L26 n=2 Tax=Encephalitozoon cuniculi TaxID=6035 RepID=Q8SRE6_ENCCU|nr:60S ribosomal protein L26 [Encephalitozoon cuniculi GB-M1]7QEP_N6 Chain N6, 60S RIBOSOMAL PROTEIN L26 [Encephalitozoon cuniculi GB-M1]AGE95171.1 60S ribosomal protein l26 [Encephalitozoon cuniculi]KMV65564.1 60S ribosomal protein L26 [Encephalitozoon cuniculi EcunIII-L]UYI26963.1 ribosomal protein uL24 [Encephalitozoon cuniculi]CAD26342.1 60S RIBOSOMAL PROTEIN L26 [Encephalitozoon cuniculi GB-M1]